MITVDPARREDEGFRKEGDGENKSRRCGGMILDS